MSIEVNPFVAKLHPYVPGEQPRESGFIKLNTNESPYPAPEQVVAAVRGEAALGVFQKYPDPVTSALRTAISERLGVSTEQILVGNGSDEVLRLICHAFLRPGSGDQIGMLYPTYVLYRTLAEMFGGGCQTFETKAPDYRIPQEAYDAAVKVFFLANPNPPLGTYYPNEELARMASSRPERLLVIDEAYVDFASGSAVELLASHPNLIVSRTFSKSYSLAGLRVGFVLGSTALIGEMNKIKDSYNINRLSQAAALAAWGATDYYQEKARCICQDREFLAQQLRARGFEVPASQGNYVFARRADARALYQQLKERKILVRYFDAPMLDDGLRITVGTRTELEALLQAIDLLSPAGVGASISGGV